MSTITVEWEDENIGFLYQNGNLRRNCYSQPYAIKRAIFEYIADLCRTPASIQQIFANKINHTSNPVPGPQPSSTYSLNFQLSMAYPSIINKYHLMKVMCESIRDYLYKTLSTLVMTAETSDLLFMAKIGSTRDWAKDCSICLLGKIGDPHGWGGHHQRISIFRPCGHSVCETPCYARLQLHHLKCPICRIPITKSFSHHGQYFSREIIDLIYDDIMTTRKGIFWLK